MYWHDSSTVNPLASLKVRPYFDNCKDYFDHHKLKPFIPNKVIAVNTPEKVTILAEKMNKLYLQFTASSSLKETLPVIKNEQLFPEFMRFYPNYEARYSGIPKRLPQAKKYVYTKQPPSLKDILETTEKPIKKSRIGFNSDLGKTNDIYSMISPMKSSDKDKMQEVDKKLQ